MMRGIFPLEAPTAVLRTVEQDLEEADSLTDGGLLLFLTGLL